MKSQTIAFKANEKITMKEFLTALEFLFDEYGQPVDKSVFLDWTAGGEITITLK